jgi:ADP-heptose:LPS heptosyltransferase
VIVECQPPVRKLLETAPGIDELVSRGEKPPQFDVEASLMSLPGIFKTTLKTVPAEIPYLSADQVRSERWRREMANDGARIRIGIAWQGSAVNQDDRFRSIHLAEFTPLARIGGVRLYPLQKGAGAEQIDEFRDQWPLVDLRERLDVDTPFADTAAIVQCLDLVITSDTSIAHLAGALGRPVWVALQADCDHRWLLERTDSPWYPTMRLFRQRTRGDWRPVFAAMAAEISEVIR